MPLLWTMYGLKVIMTLLLFALCGVSLAGAAGVGTFSIEKTSTDVSVNGFGIATLYMDNTWDPKADDVFIYLTWDPAVLQYVSTDWKVGNSVSATLNSPGELFLQYADWTNQYPTGRVSIADINFKGLAEGQTTMDLRVDHVRSHIAASPTNFVDLTQSAVTTPGVFAVGAGGAIPTATMTSLPTVTLAPTGTLTQLPTVTLVPTGTMTLLPTVTIDPNMTFTTMPTVTPIGTQTFPTVTPIGPISGSDGGSEDYTGVLTATPTVTATSTATMTATMTGGATPTTGTGTDVTGTTTATPGATMTPDTGMPTVTETIDMGTPVVTTIGVTPVDTTAPTTRPPTTATTAAGLDALPLAVGVLAGIALLVAGRRR